MEEFVLEVALCGLARNDEFDLGELADFVIEARGLKEQRLEQ
jgi:hypothetical protein